MSGKRVRLKDLSGADQSELHKLLSSKNGNKIELLQELMEQYNVSQRTLYGWRLKLRNLYKAVDSEEEDYMFVKGKSTMYDDEGNIKLQWVKEDTDKKAYHNTFEKAIDELVARVEGNGGVTPTPPDVLDNHRLNVYIANDVHIGAMMRKSETGDYDWDNKIALDTGKRAIDFLIANSPDTEECVIADLGDLLEADNFKNQTPHSGHTLDVDGRWNSALSTAMEFLVYMVERALEKHDKVHFLNISGNHDMTTGHSIRAFIAAWFRKDSRVTVDQTPIDIKYYRFHKNLIGFAHGDGLKMREAGEVMAVDNSMVFSEVPHRFFHFGHFHKDIVYDGRLCKCESHRNLAPLNHWASHKGFRRQVGTMKCLTYHKDYGEISRTLFNLTEEE